MPSDEIVVTAFQIHGDSVFYDAVTGERLPDTFAGYCQVCYGDGKTVLFKTGLNDLGERWWQVERNDPKRPYRFASHNAR